MRHFAETAARLAQAPPPAIGPAGAAMPQYLSRRSVNLDSSRLRGLGWVPRQGLEDMLRAALDQSRGGAL
jgi:nucleoside-diphosphate-sugar epimerase